MGYSQHNIGNVMLDIEEIMMDVGNHPSAFVCQNIGPPLVERNPATQYAGGGTGDTLEDILPSSFTVTIGGKTIDGWVLVGSCIGAVVGIVTILALLQFCGCCAASRKLQQTDAWREDGTAKKDRSTWV